MEDKLEEMRKWFFDQILIAEKVGPIGFATRATLMKGLEKLEELMNE